MTSLARLADRIEAALAALADLRERTERAGPWPLAELYGTEAEAHWGPPELLAHLDEMLPFWLGQAELVMDGAGGGGEVPFGRIADDPIRIGVIGRDRQVPLRELFDRLASEGARVARRLRSMTAAEAAAVGIHPRLGPMTVEAQFERFVANHLEEHVEQLRTILAERGA